MIEFFDLLDFNGIPTGQKKIKQEVHRDGDWHRTVHAWIINDKGELLIQKRSNSKVLYPGMWDISSAGHLSLGENSIEACVRETNEELGINIQPDEFEYLFTCRRQAVENEGTFIDNEFNDVYLVQKDIKISDIKMRSEEVEDIKYIHFFELEKLVSTKDKNLVLHIDEYGKLFKILHEKFDIKKG